MSHLNQLETPELRTIDNITIEYGTNELVIRRSWFSTLNFLGCLFATPLFALFTSAIFSVGVCGAEMTLTQKCIAVVADLGFAAITLWTAYATVAICVNSTTIRIADKHIRTRHAPLAWSGNHNVAADEVARCLTTKQVFRFRRTESHSFSVECDLKNGTRKKIIVGLLTQREATFIKQEVARYLGVEAASTEALPT